MEHIGLKFASGYMLVSLDPDTNKVIIEANIKNTDLTGKITLKPAKIAKENN